MDLAELAYGKDCPAAATGISAAAPIAGTAIATLNGTSFLPAGTYDIAVVTRAYSTGSDEVSGLEKNMELRLGATVLRNQMLSTKQPGGIYYLTDVLIPAATNLTVNATANASAGVIYAATIIASKNG